MEMKNKTLIAIIVVLILATALLGWKYHEQSKPVAEETISNLPDIKHAIIYQQINDRAPKRTIEENIEIFKDLKADFIFRGVQRWFPIPGSKSTAIDEVLKLGGTRQDAQTMIDSNYTYEDLKGAISKIKQEIPDLIFTSGISAQRIGSTDKNDLTGEILGKDKTYAMALDPGKWGISISKATLQKKFVESL